MTYRLVGLFLEKNQEIWENRKKTMEITDNSTTRESPHYCSDHALSVFSSLSRFI